MSAAFDPYHKWLGIPPEEHPANHYRLLGIEPLESDPDVIESAADQRMAHLRTFQAGKYGAISQKLLNEVATAKVCLLNRAKKAAYDEELREKLAAKAAVMGSRRPVSTLKVYWANRLAGEQKTFTPGTYPESRKRFSHHCCPETVSGQVRKQPGKAPPNRCGLLPAPVQPPVWY